MSTRQKDPKKEGKGKPASAVQEAQEKATKRVIRDKHLGSSSENEVAGATNKGLPVILGDPGHVRYHEEMRLSGTDNMLEGSEPGEKGSDPGKVPPVSAPLRSNLRAYMSGPEFEAFAAAHELGKTGEPSATPLIDPSSIEKLSPAMARFLSRSAPFAHLSGEEFRRMAETWSGLMNDPARDVLRSSYPSGSESKAGLLVPWAQAFLPEDLLREEAKKMLNNDPRLERIDRIIILDIVSSRIGELKEAKISIGDLVGECVEQHKANKKAADAPVSIKPEVAVRAIIEHLKFVDRTNKAIQTLEETGYASTVAIETLRDGQYVRDEELIPIIDATPADCLDQKVTPEKTVRDLLLAVAMGSETNQLIDAVSRKLK